MLIEHIACYVDQWDQESQLHNYLVESRILHTSCSQHRQGENSNRRYSTQYTVDDIETVISIRSQTSKGNGGQEEDETNQEPVCWGWHSCITDVKCHAEYHV